MNDRLIKNWPWVFVISFTCFSCGEKSDKSTAAPDNPANPPTSSNSSNQSLQSIDVSPEVVKTVGSMHSSTGENTVVTSGGNAEPIQTWFYTTNGDERLKTLINSKNGHVISSRTFDEAGNLKWADQFSYSSDSKNPVEMRRTKPDGQVIQILYKYSADGKQTRIVIGTGGKVVSAEVQDAYLNK
jgi:hypothetical protein